MNPQSSASPSDLAVAIGSLGALGIESYQLSQGAPVSVTSVGGLPVVSTGSAVATNWLTIALIGVGVLLVIWLVLR